MSRLPKFVNPYSVLEQTETVSRKKLSAEDDEEEYITPDSSLLKEFEGIMKRSLDVGIEERPKKRVRKEKTTDNDNDSTLFRLVSNGPPIILSLKPKPPPQIKVREPECEDNEAQAEERRLRALAVAVDSEWIMQESRNFDQCSSVGGSVISIKTSSTSNPPMMVICHKKPPRKTRPPVDRHILGYPYNPSGNPEPLEIKAKCEVEDIDKVLGDDLGKRRRRRRRKSVREHPVRRARFWRPEVGVKGKGLGYGMGYARSLVPL